MKRGIVLVAASVAAAVVLLVSGAEGEPPSPSQADEQAVLRVVREGQAAVLRDDPAKVCSLLTRRARRNSRRLYGLDRYPDGRPRPKPTNCVAAIGYQIDDERRSGNLRYLRRGGYLHRTRVVRIQGNRAHVHKGTRAGSEIYLLRTSEGWRGDFANFAPFDGSSGY